jgi:cyclic pyranopterin phosphate synthase
VDAGLRIITFGYYGSELIYDAYVARPGAYHFTEGYDRELQFTTADESRLRSVAAELETIRRSGSQLYTEPIASIRSIPDWALKGPAVEVPCDAYNMIWVGPDGSVRLCFVDFPLGNILKEPFRELLFTEAHSSAAIDAFSLNCQRCHCCRDTRIQKHLASRVHYSALGGVIGRVAQLLSYPSGADARVVSSSPGTSGLIQIGTRRVGGE